MAVDFKEAIRTLAGSVADLGAVGQTTEGRLLVLATALGALVRTHPQPEVFAAEFRRLWLQAGQQHANESVGEDGQAGIDQALAILEESCSAPLNVRSPDVAEPPRAG